MTDTITPEAGKTYLTRDGRRARCICTDRQGDSDLPVICLLQNGNVELAEVYTGGGHYRADKAEDRHDLVSEARAQGAADERERLAPHLHTAIAVITEMLEREGISDPETFPPLVEIRAAWLRSQKDTTQDKAD